MSIINKFYLLQYKNWKLQFRKKLVTVLEITIPALFCLMMMALRTLVIVYDYPDPTYYPSYSVDKIPQALFEKMYPVGVPPFFGLAYTPQTSLTNSIMGNTAAKLIDSQIGLENIVRKYTRVPFKTLVMHIVELSQLKTAMECQKMFHL